MPSCLPSTLAISQIPHSHSIRSRIFFPKSYSKEVYFNHDLSTTKKLQAGVDLVTDLLGVTLGPKGRNVVLENKYAPPKIVNDGETILKENTEEKFDKKIINERIARLSDGIAIIQVGAQTVVELKDKKLRVEDALSATRAAIEEGVVVGVGCYLLRLSMKVDSIKDFLDNEEQKWRDAMIFVDTEFPGTIYNSTKPYYVLTPAERYALLKANVEEIQPIQVGITICYVDRFTITWQFDICDFDISLHPYVPESITLLESSGINLKYIRRWGVPSLWLGQLLINSGLIGLGSEAKWVVFQGGYDIAILLKAVWQFMMPWRIMMKSILPPTLEGFMAYTRCIFGGGIYDIKCWMRVCGLYGGLERLAKQLMVERKVGKPHQAGSDCLLICHVFFRMMALYFSSKDDRFDHYLPCKGQLSGFEY